MAKDIKKNEERTSYRVLLAPWITEEATRLNEFGKYVFRIYPEADKNEVKKAIEESFGVTVTAVNVVSVPKKRRNRGGISGWRSGYKKAIVTLKAGEKIELFEGK